MIQQPSEPTELPRSSRKGRRRSASLGCIVLPMGVFILFLAAFAWALLYRVDVVVEAGKPVQIEIPKGATAASIGRQLSAAGVVGNANMFWLRSRMLQADGQLKAGVYDLRTGMEYEEVIDALKAGPQVKYTTVTIPEGFVIEQIAARFEEKAGIPAAQFLQLAKGGAMEFASKHPYLAKAYNNSLEGYLFPKTYRVPEGATARDVISMMLAQFDREISAIDLSPAYARGMSLQEIVIVASIIERETKVASERPIVASVIYNRLAKNMRLEIDATVEYVLPGNRFRLRYSDLEVDSPYNTYRNFGLTPGPISNPGLASIEAAVRPADTRYIYYVLTAPDGSHTFAETFEEFELAKRRSKEVFGR